MHISANTHRSHQEATTQHAGTNAPPEAADGNMEPNEEKYQQQNVGTVGDDTVILDASETIVTTAVSGTQQEMTIDHQHRTEMKTRKTDQRKGRGTAAESWAKRIKTHQDEV